MASCLVVDDSKIVRKMARRMLEALHFTVHEAADGKEAAAFCANQRPELILLDWYMPRMDGLAFVKHLRRMAGGEHPRVIFCTTENGLPHIMEAMNAGADEYMMKPFDEDILKGKLRQVGLL